MTIFDFDIDAHTDRQAARRFDPRARPGDVAHVATVEKPLTS